jgi:hypothetical protein
MTSIAMPVFSAGWQTSAGAWWLLQPFCVPPFHIDVHPQGVQPQGLASGHEGRPLYSWS